jgi:hypothetical protein
MAKAGSSPETMVYSFIYSLISMRALLRKTGKIFGHRPRSPNVDGGRTFSVVRPDSPRGFFTTLLSYPSAMQPSTGYLPPWLG